MGNVKCRTLYIMVSTLMMQGQTNQIIKEIEQNQLTWYGHVQRMTEEKTAQNSTEVDAKTEQSTRKAEEKLDGRNKEGHERKKPK